jgi:hypothetical protein
MIAEWIASVAEQHLLQQIRSTVVLEFPYSQINAESEGCSEKLMFHIGFGASMQPD